VSNLKSTLILRVSNNPQSIVDPRESIIWLMGKFAGNDLHEKEKNTIYYTLGSDRGKKEEFPKK